MTMFRVYVEEVNVEVWDVEANTKEEAENNYSDGNWVYSKNKHTEVQKRYTEEVK
jgi:hypothetical protein